MKAEIIALFALVTLISFASQPVHSQMDTQRARTNPEQWHSHQMNQPAPSASERDDLSNDRLDEIRQLYVEAQRELEKKPTPGNAPSAPISHQTK